MTETTVGKQLSKLILGSQGEGDVDFHVQSILRTNVKRMPTSSNAVLLCCQSSRVVLVFWPGFSKSIEY